jgi:hypothetical protein
VEWRADLVPVRCRLCQRYAEYVSDPSRQAAESTLTTRRLKAESGPNPAIDPHSVEMLNV